MRLLQLNTFYPAYLADFYARNPALAAQPSSNQIGALIADGFSAGHMTGPYLRALGYEVEVVIANCMEIQGKWAIEHGRAPPNSQADLFALAAARIEHFKPDVLYLQDPIVYDSKFLSVLTHQPKLVVGWRAAPIAVGTDWTRFDLMLSSDAGYRKLALDYGARTSALFMPGFSRAIAERVAHTPKAADISFCGQITGEHLDRIKGLSALVDYAAKSRLITQLHMGIRPHLMVSDALRAADLGAAWGMDMYRAVRAGRIAPNFHINAAVSRSQNMRLLEITGVGSFMLNEADPHLDRQFAVGKEVETFRDIPELLEKVRYYLDHETEREEIARRGHERCLRDYSMEKRALWFDEIIRETLRNLATLPHRTIKPAPSTRPAASASLEQAERLLTDGRLAEAAEVLNRIVQRDTRNARALELLGKIALAAGDQGRAQQLFAAARAIGQTGG